MSRESNIEIFNDTLQYIKEDKQLSNSIFDTKKDTKIYRGKDYKLSFSINKYNNVKITKHKTFEEAIYQYNKNKNLKIAVLNFASATTPGGGVTKGSQAQEESLCRCSTLYPCLNTSKLWEEFYSPNRIESNPLHNDDIIYTPNIIICKSDDGLFRRGFYGKVDVITCAAPNLRENPSNQYNSYQNTAVKASSLSDSELYKIHVKRALNIINAAKDNKVDILILGAFGCGAFKNDPYVVAEAYRDVLKQEFNNFKEIIFAIYCRDFEDENYLAFREIL